MTLTLASGLRPRRTLPIVLTLAVTILLSWSALTASSSSAVAAAGPSAAPHADATALGARLTERFYALLRSGDATRLGPFLSPAFQLQRANGMGVTKAQYLADLPTIGEATLSQLIGTRSGDVLVVRYLADVDGVIDGLTYSPGPAPRISTFIKTNQGWQLTSHANFNALEGMA